MTCFVRLRTEDTALYINRDHIRFFYFDERSYQTKIVCKDDSNDIISVPGNQTNLILCNEATTSDRAIDYS